MQPRKPASEDLVAEAWKRVRSGSAPTQPSPDPPIARQRPDVAPQRAVRTTPEPLAEPPPVTARTKAPTPRPAPKPSRVERRPEPIDPKAVARSLTRVLRIGVFLFILFSLLGGFFSVFERGSQEFTVEETATPVAVFEVRSITADTVLDSDISEGLVIESDGVTIDCDGHTIRGIGEGVGILLLGRSGVTVTNCRLVNFDAGIHMVGGSDNSLLDCSVSGASVGILLSETSGNTVVGADLNANGTGLAIMGGASANTITDSTASGSGSDGFAAFDAGPDNVLLRNTAERNRGRGFVDESGFPVAGRYEGNRCDANGIQSEPDGLCSLSG